MNGSEAERPQAIREALQQIEAEIPRLRRYARYLGHEPDHADDLVREGLVRAVAQVPTAIAKIHTGPPGTSLRGWLFAILRSCHIEETRRGQRLDALASTHEASSPTTRRNQEAGAALSELRDAYLSLSEERREVLLLVAIEGLQHEEAAAILGVPLGAVRSRLAQGRQALRQALAAGRAALASPLLGAPHAGHQYLMAPRIAMAMPEGVPRLGRSPVQASILAPVDFAQRAPDRPGA